ncbi:DUF1254 domain-containing protein [Cupriavidus sp. UYPR2.512]|uniref:DUF1254 domain-containing protein n=1 Tax=Cupriavidus sp. UYPR2.512 TaxID=1080187 RepID=UPI00036CE62C|nr:DUF1254 domain-containing protein [Cupriavidus sp. UYPR2.512]UIF89948.1 DUF1254 domain-containing protein [Cupriavidus necator]
MRALLNACSATLILRPPTLDRPGSMFNMPPRDSYGRRGITYNSHYHSLDPFVDIPPRAAGSTSSCRCGRLCPCGWDTAAMQGPLAFAVSHYPDGDTATRLYDELEYQRAVQAYIWAQPLVGLGAMAEGARCIGIRPMGLFVFDELEQVNQRLQAGNDDVVYSFSYANLRDSGPLVVEIPAGNQYGVIPDAWQRPVEDVGRIGPDAGHGGRYLLVPPASCRRSSGARRCHRSRT